MTIKLTWIKKRKAIKNSPFSPKEKQIDLLSLWLVDETAKSADTTDERGNIDIERDQQICKDVVAADLVESLGLIELTILSSKKF